MPALIYKEISIALRSFSTLLSLLIFQIFIFFFLWINHDTNMLQQSHASLDTYFQIVAYLLIFLISALAMKSFTEEYTSENIYLLLSLPIENYKIILSKQISVFFITLIGLAPTFFYGISLYWLVSPVGNIDLQHMLFSFIGLIVMTFCFVCLAVLSSSLTSNAIFAFLFSVFLIYFLFDAPYFIAKSIDSFIDPYTFMRLSIFEHYQLITKGVFDFRNYLYLLGIILLSSAFTLMALKKRIK